MTPLSELAPRSRAVGLAKAALVHGWIAKDLVNPIDVSAIIM